ncbi:MAG: adenylyltransferase/cytidyltransferase family protein [Nitrosopumilales archaeon]|jgi:FAD synthetase|nr:adenylyltransferase/cytidyltransferase family protein [Nitrosopumilales archaeon]
MDPLDKAILGSFYLSSLDPSVASLDRLRSRLPLPREIYNEKIQKLVDLGFVEKNDKAKLTFLGRDAFKVVLVGGVFDLIHPGHIHTLKAAKAQGDVLIVVIARISTAAMIKKDRRIYHDEKLRAELVSSLRLVDLAILGREGTLYETVEHIKPDVIALGYDQAHSEKDIADNCQKRNLTVRVVRLNTPVPGTKSSEIKDYLGESFYRI